MLLGLLVSLAYADDAAVVPPPDEPPSARPQGLHLPPPAPPDGYTIGLGVGYAFDPLDTREGAIFPSDLLTPNCFGVQMRGPRYTWAPYVSVGGLVAGQTDDDPQRDAFATVGVSWFASPHETTLVAARPILMLLGSNLYQSAGPRDWELTTTATLALGVQAQRWIGSAFAIDLTASGVQLNVTATASEQGPRNSWRAIGASANFRPGFSVMGTFYFERPRRTARAAAKASGVP